MIYCLRHFNVLLGNGEISNDCVTDYLNFIHIVGEGLQFLIEVEVPPLLMCSVFS